MLAYCLHRNFSYLSIVLSTMDYRSHLPDRGFQHAHRNQAQQQCLSQPLRQQTHTMLTKGRILL